MPMRSIVFTWLAALLATSAVSSMAVPSVAAAQGGALGRLKKRAEDEMKRRAETEADRAVDKKIDDLENAIRCTIGDDQCIKKAEQSGKKVIVTNEDGEPVAPAKPAQAKPAPAAAPSASSSGGEAAPSRPGEGAWANYDFVPGERPLLVTDFSTDVVGDFPKRLEASEGNYEIVEIKGSRWLRGTGQANLMLVPAGGVLPTRWTFEFEMFGEQGDCWIFPSGTREGNQTYFTFGANYEGGVVRDDGRTARTTAKGTAGEPLTARIMIDGAYAKAYINETRVVNLPNLEYTRGDKVLVYCDGNEAHPLFLRNIRLASGGRKLYDALAETGRVATQGIYFDTGSDRLRPESTPTLREIGGMLTEHPELKLVIEGHTDNTGNAAANKTLSQKRAEAVRQYLVATHGVTADRLTALGVGSDKPVAPNTTTEGRQQNRRVELVRN